MKPSPPRVPFKASSVDQVRHQTARRAALITLADGFTDIEERLAKLELFIIGIDQRLRTIETKEPTV